MSCFGLKIQKANIFDRFSIYRPTADSIFVIYPTCRIVVKKKTHLGQLFYWKIIQFSILNNADYFYLTINWKFRKATNRSVATDRNFLQWTEEKRHSKFLDNSIEACLAFFIYPEEDWISLRTTNIIEGLNKEFKRRTNPMEIVAGENTCYTLLVFICLKMELHWRSKPTGKGRKDLIFLK